MDEIKDKRKSSKKVGGGRFYFLTEHKPYVCARKGCQNEKDGNIFYLPDPAVQHARTRLCPGKRQFTGFFERL